MSTQRTFPTVVFLLLLSMIASTVVLSGCRAEPAGEKSLPGPARAVETLLKLRSKNSTDTEAYARYLESTQVAFSLAQDAAGRQGKPSIPGWSKVEVTNSGDTTATVLVTWRPSSDFESWPATTAFMLKRRFGVWIVTDAVEGARSEEATDTPSGDATSVP